MKLIKGIKTTPTTVMVLIANGIIAIKYRANTTRYKIIYCQKLFKIKPKIIFRLKASFIEKFLAKIVSIKGNVIDAMIAKNIGIKNNKENMGLNL